MTTVPVLRYTVAAIPKAVSEPTNEKRRPPWGGVCFYALVVSSSALRVRRVSRAAASRQCFGGFDANERLSADFHDLGAATGTLKAIISIVMDAVGRAKFFDRVRRQFDGRGSLNTSTVRAVIRAHIVSRNSVCGTE
jgi:hypothetical protein